MAALVFFVLSMLAKATLVTLPFVLVLLDSWPLSRLKSSGLVRIVMEKLPFLAISAATCMITVLAQSNNHTVHPLSEISLGGDFRMLHWRIRSISRE